MGEYVPQEYPRWLPEHQAVAQTAEEHQALKAGRATVEVVLKSAQGDTRAIVLKKES